MVTPEITAAMASVPTKLEDLRKAYDLLRSFSPALLSFNLNWTDLHDHFAAIQTSIHSRIQQLDAKASAAASQSPASKPELAAASAVTAEARPVTNPRPELVSFCSNMDGLGLRSYIVGNRGDVVRIRNELGAALALAPDPARLVLDALDGFNREKGRWEKDGDLQVIKRTCLNFLEQLRNLRPEPEISASVKAMAKKVGEEWKAKIIQDEDDGENGIEALAFLELLAAYRLVPEFDKDDILDVFVLISRRRQATQHCKNLGLGEHMQDLIKKLSTKGRLLDAVKFIHHLNLADKFPLVPLLKEYVKDSRKAAQDIREENNSKQAKNEATAKELSALKAVVKAVEDYNLQSQYSCVDLNKRITQLEQQKANKKRPAPTDAGAAASNTKVHRQHLQPPPKKHSRPMASMTSSQYAVASHPPPPLAHNPMASMTSSQYAPLAHNPMASMTSSQYAVASHPPPPLAHNQSQLGLTEQPQYQGLLLPYGLARTGAPYDAAVPIVSGAHYGLSRNRSPLHSRSHLYSSESLLGTGLYDMPVAYGTYAPSSHTTNTSSLYPRGI